MFVFSGSLSHEFLETVPVMLLDSLEAFDADRIVTPVEYVTDYSVYLVVEFVSDDETALDADYQRTINM